MGMSLGSVAGDLLSGGVDKFMQVVKNPFKSGHLDLKTGLQKAYETNWSMINTFNVQFILNNNLKKLVHSDVMNENINLHIISFNTPDFTNSGIEHFVANRWRIQNGRDELYRFNMTFRDKDQMTLYKSFYKMYRATTENYFDTCCFTIHLDKDADYSGESDKKFMTFEKTIIESISNIAFSNETQNQIAEFTVQFKCVSPTIH